MARQRRHDADQPRSAALPYVPGEQAHFSR
jgi:hypothetical protein